MSAPWPEFQTRQQLDEELSWTAAFDSWDQYHDDVYYVVEIYRRGARIDTFMVKVGILVETPDLEREVREQIAHVAATGRTNTAYSR
jgi:hypothetical protein